MNEYDNYFEIISSGDPSLHLSAMVNWRGYTSRPLQLRHDADAWSYLAIHNEKSRVQFKQLKPEDLDPWPNKWFDGNERFYISCNAKPAPSKEASYLSVHRKTHYWKGEPTYTTGCVPSIKEDTKDGVSMLFKLVPIPKDSPGKQSRPPNPPETPGEGGNDQREGSGGPANDQSIDPINEITQQASEHQ